MSLSRRRLLQAAASAAIAGPAIITSLRAAETPPSDRITLGFIGMGIMARGHLGKFLNQPDVQVLAVCEVVKERRDQAVERVTAHYAKQAKSGEAKGCSAYVDFRELVERKDIDAVVIATPDHWHAIPCIHAAKAKKDVYCEKPLTHTIAEGAAIAGAVRANNVVFQTGSQQRSEFGGKFRTAVELVRNGRIGKVKTIRVGVGGPPKPCDLPEQPTPEGTDWNLWLGPAPMRGFNDALCPKGIHGHFPAWRAYREYGGGGMADMGAHHFDIAQWAIEMDGSGPVSIEPPAQGETGLRFVYANGIEMFHGGKSGCTFEGELGTIYVDRGVIESAPDTILKEPLGPDAKRVYQSNDHARNWLDCVKSRKDPICTAEIGASSATVCHLGNIGYQLRRKLTWDPAKQQFVGDDEANLLVGKKYREPWKLG